MRLIESLGYGEIKGAVTAYRHTHFQVLRPLDRLFTYKNYNKL